MTELFGRELGVDYVYALADSETEEVRYVGVTDNPERRLKEHCGGLYSLGQTGVQHWIHSLWQQGRNVKMLILEEITYPSKGGREYREHLWIQAYFAEGAKLFNHKSKCFHLPPSIEVSATLPSIVLEE